MRVTISVLLVAGGVLALAGARAEGAEPRLAVAPIPTGQAAPADLQRAFQDELPRALLAAGFPLTPPNEVDMRVAERPELLRCAAGGCLAEEAAFLRVGRLLLPRLQPLPDRSGFTVALSIYDAADKKTIAEVVERCNACTAGVLRTAVKDAVERLRAAITETGTLEVISTPEAALSIDGRPVGGTPFTGPLSPGDHLIVVEAGGARVERQVSVLPGQTAHVELTIAGAPPLHRKTRFRVVKWVLLAFGVAAAGAGGALWAFDGRGTCPHSSAQECPQVYDTLGVGAALVATGGAFALTSVLMLALDKPVERAPVKAGLAPLAGGAALSAWGRF